MRTILALLIMLAATTVAHAETDIWLLGTGNPNPYPDRFGPSVAVVVDGESYIFDAGNGSFRRAAAIAEAHDVPALDAAGLKRIFLTHLHSDHMTDVDEYLTTGWIQGRADNLALFGPPGTVAFATSLQLAFADDINGRITGPMPHSETGMIITSHDLKEPGPVYEDERVQITAIPACHGTKAAYAYKLESADRTILISGDTTYCPAVEAAARGVDILIHEVYSDAGFKALPPDWARYHEAFHTSAADLARLANAARPGLLVLYHQISWGDVPPEAALEEVRALTDVPVRYGRDMERY